MNQPIKPSIEPSIDFDALDTYDAQEAAMMLKCSLQTVLELAESGELPGCKIGIKWVFLRDELRRYLLLQTKAQQAERRAKSGADAREAQGVVHGTRRTRRRKNQAIEAFDSLMK
jgi:excisionase family DNA binding protein